MLVKNKLGLCALFAALTFVRADDLTPPVPIHQVNPEWPAELSKGYLEEVVHVDLTVDADGIPYSLKGTVPDNVVMALSKWRFQPGKKDGRAAAFSVSIRVPVRRTINPDVEFTYGRRWTFFAKELTDAFKSGAELDAAGAAQIRQNLAADPKNINARATLLAYYATAMSANSEELRKGRLEQIVWLVQNAPESALWASPLVQINALGGPLQDSVGYAEVRDLWLQQVASNPENSNILGRAANFLKIADPEKALGLRILAESKSTTPPSSLGENYGLAGLGVTGLDFKRGLAATAAEKLPETPFAQKARSTLVSTSDVPLLLTGLATVTIAGRSLAKAGRVPDGYAEFCEALLAKAKQIQPAITTSCDSAAAIPEEDNTAQRIRVGGNVQAANLITKVQPEYPAEAKSRHIQGTVEFTVIIDKQGKTTILTLNSGPLALYESARDAVRQWRYKPTSLNGRPVEVITRIDVNFALIR